MERFEGIFLKLRVISGLEYEHHVPQKEDIFHAHLVEGEEERCIGFVV